MRPEYYVEFSFIGNEQSVSNAEGLIRTEYRPFLTILEEKPLSPFSNEYHSFQLSSNKDFSKLPIHAYQTSKMLTVKNRLTNKLKT